MTKNKELPIEQKNRTIAEFMGYEQYEDAAGIWFKKGGLIKCMHPKLQDMKYHTSWDWITRPAKKIAGMILDEKWENTIEAVEYWKPIGEGLQEVDIKKVHQGVYDFIQWYNRKK